VNFPTLPAAREALERANRHFLERHDLGTVLFKEVNTHLKKNGLMLCEGSIVDATIIPAHSSTIKFDGSNGFELVAL
jgi:IS5 family transposase